MNKTAAAILITILAALSVHTYARNYTYPELVARLYDLEYLATLPEPGEKCLQWSSYDRSSRYDETTGKYVNWDANSDGFGGKGWIRKENGKLVLAEIEGPGCIWRTWSATPQNGHVRIYLDGSPKPAVDLPFISYFNGENAPFNRPALVHIVASGKNNYTPIPFQKSCKIVADPDYGEFHHFTYTLFPKGTKVPTFTMNLDRESQAALDKANAVLTSGGTDPAAPRPGQATQSHDVSLEAGAVQMISLEGPRALTALRVRGTLPYDIEQQRRILRELAIKIYWDNQPEPAVWSPLGDFFGTGPGANPYRSLPLGVTESEAYCLWYMPFASAARIELHNQGSTWSNFELEITHAPLSRPIESLTRFHAKWHRDAFLPAEPERQIDWTLLATKGRGRFCGVNLEIWNPRGGWWGEGDEKFFVDGEKFPSTYGTGSEDYFGYAWSDPTLFENAFHNQPISEGNKGHTSVNRWHIADNIPFQTSFAGYIEKYFANERPTQYASTVYWYLAPGGTDPYQPVPVEQRVDYYTRLTYPMDIAGILVLEKPLGEIEAQGMGSFTAAKWTDNDQLWWIGKPGAKLNIALDVPEDGTYKLIADMTKAADYAIVQYHLDGKPLGAPLDLYHPDGVIKTGPVPLGPVPLTKGRHVLTVEIVGANPKAIQRYMFGLDTLKLKLLSKGIPAAKPAEPKTSSPGLASPLATAPDIPLIPQGIKSRAITWENRDGQPGRGGMAAGKLGVGRKGSPCIGNIPSGKTQTLMDIDGCGIIRHIWLTLPERGIDELRNIILRMYWDNSPVPSVETPLSDFFGTAHGRSVNLTSEYLQVVNGKGFNSYFPMPFHTHAKITVENDMPGNKTIGCLFFQIDYELHDSLPENIGLFHAQFRRQNPTLPKEDYVVLDNVQGPGIFLGCMIGVRPLEPHWWGEGEMKFYFDGDTDFPTICGTGTEDYFGNAWGMDRYQTPYLGCTLLEPADPAAGKHELISMYRFHVKDPVYFTNSFKATIQQIGWFPDGLGERSGDDWCSVAYWYQPRPVESMPPLPDRAARTAGIMEGIKENSDTE